MSVSTYPDLRHHFVRCRPWRVNTGGWCSVPLSAWLKASRVSLFSFIFSPWRTIAVSSIVRNEVLGILGSLTIEFRQLYSTMAPKYASWQPKGEGFWSPKPIERRSRTKQWNPGYMCVHATLWTVSIFKSVQWFTYTLLLIFLGKWEIAAAHYHWQPGWKSLPFLRAFRVQCWMAFSLW